MKKKDRLTKKDIFHLAKLSAVEIDDKEVDKYTKQLCETIDFAANLDEPGRKETSDKLPTKHPHPLRSDRVNKERMLSSKDALSNSKKKNADYFIVPRII